MTYDWMPKIRESVRVRAVRRLGLSAVAVVASTCVIAAVLSAPASAGSGGQSGVSAAKAGRRLVASLNGDKEVPPPGDPNGRGHVVIKLRPFKNKVCAIADWRRIGTPVMAHIHRGRSGVAGDVVVDLSAVVVDGRACARNVDRTLIRKIRTHPRRYYFNMHTATFPAGAIRGQLHL